MRAELPILAPEIDKYPEELFQLAERDSASEWHLLYTRSRREKDLMRRLHSMEIPFYAPCVVSKKRSPAGRVRSTWTPLFANYVFLLGDSEQLLAAHKTNCLSRATTIADKSRTTADLLRLDRVIRSGAPVQIEQKLAAGQLVRVKAGPFKNCEGIVEQRRNGDCLVVNVEFLQQAVSVELDDFILEKL